MDLVLLSRLQFALTIAFHYIFPPLTIGISVVMVYLEAQHLRTGDPLFEKAAKFWTNIFALNFAIGVASGIVMEFQFGTNWAAYSRFVGDVFGSALAAEGIFAFFLESGFLALLVFGWDRVSAKMHLFATAMVCLGSIFSSIWIVVANSWQQTPAGHHIVQMVRDGQPLFIDGEPVLRAEIVNFWALVFNPSTVDRLVHVWIGAFIMGTFFVMSISAWYLLKKQHEEFAKKSFTGALIFATIASLAALVSGHSQANNVYEYQPAKLAAFEGHFQTGRGDMSLIGLPDEEEERVRFNIAIPGGLSFLIHWDFEQPVVGLDRFRPEDRPPVLISYASYHIMIALGMAFIALTVLASFLHWRGKLYDTRWLMWVFVFAVLGPLVANQLGWVAAEVGRQPWIVHPPVEWTADGDVVVGPNGVVVYDEGLALRTEDAVSTSVTASQVLGSLIGFALIYLFLLLAWLYVLDRKIRKGPEPVDTGPEGDAGGLLEAAAGRVDHRASLVEEAEGGR
jgi:cytochrome d ubiquinol oxidase subunit I